ncbi:MAG TPA: hypothetical protein VH877_27975 [Polyangia bacterium]|jgi:hypothetical protein|nr:hypothetical protein [Polyangia bacterium]
MPSKMVLDRQKSAATVISTGEAHAREIAERLRERLRDYLAEGEHLPDVELLIVLVLRYLQGADDMMGMADEMHRREVEKDRSPRRQRNEIARQLYQLMVELREVATGFFGGPALPQLGFRGPTPQDPAQLLRYAGEVVAAMTENPLPPSRVKGVSLNSLDWVWRIKQARATLDASLKAVAREARPGGGTLERKNEAIVEFDERLTGTAAFVAGLLRLVGEEEAATLVRRALRRYGKPQGETPKEDGEEGGAQEAGASEEGRANAEESASPPAVPPAAEPSAPAEALEPAESEENAERSSEG